MQKIVDWRDIASISVKGIYSMSKLTLHILEHQRFISVEIDQALQTKKSHKDLIGRPLKS